MEDARAGEEKARAGARRYRGTISPLSILRFPVSTANNLYFSTKRFLQIGAREAPIHYDWHGGHWHPSHTPRDGGRGLLYLEGKAGVDPMGWRWR